MLNNAARAAPTRPTNAQPARALASTTVVCAARGKIGPVPSNPRRAAAAVALAKATGIMLRAEHGAVLVEAIAGIGVRIRVRFSDGVPVFPATHSLATGDTAPRLGSAVVRQAGDTILVYAEGLVVRAAQHPVRLTVTDTAGHVLIAESSGAGVWQGRLAHVLSDPPSLGERN